MNAWPHNLIDLWRMSPILAMLLVANAAMMGASVGSFFTTAGHRFRNGEHNRRGIGDALKRGSRCDACDGFIRHTDNIPVISWLMLHGRCRLCLQKISRWYLVNELLGASVTVLVVALYGVTIQGAAACLTAWLVIWGYTAVPYLMFSVDISETEHTKKAEKILAVRQSNREAAEAHAAKERKALPLLEEMGPFPMYMYTEGKWGIIDMLLLANKNKDGRYSIVANAADNKKKLFPYKNHSIPGADPEFQTKTPDGWSYGPFDTLSEGFDALRVHMIRWSLKTLLESLDTSNTRVTMLRIRLEDAVNDHSVKAIRNSMSLSVWIKQLYGLLSMQGQGESVVEGLATLNRYLSVAPAT